MPLAALQPPAGHAAPAAAPAPVPAPLAAAAAAVAAAAPAEAPAPPVAAAQPPALLPGAAAAAPAAAPAPPAAPAALDEPEQLVPPFQHLPEQQQQQVPAQQPQQQQPQDLDSLLLEAADLPAAAAAGLTAELVTGFMTLMDTLPHMRAARERRLRRLLQLGLHAAAAQVMTMALRVAGLA